MYSYSARIFSNLGIKSSRIITNSLKITLFIAFFTSFSCDLAFNRFEAFCNFLNKVQSKLRISYEEEKFIESMNYKRDLFYSIEIRLFYLMNSINLFSFSNEYFFCWRICFELIQQVINFDLIWFDLVFFFY